MTFVEKDRDNFFALHRLDPFMAGHRGFICGGCFKNVFNQQTIKDVDIFFENEQDWVAATAYYDERCGEEHDFFFCYENDNVKAYVHKQTGVRVELCRRIFGTPAEIIAQFDFTIVKAAYFKKLTIDANGEEQLRYALLLHPDFFEHLHVKRLVIDDAIPFPMSTMERMFRYVAYGYTPCRETKIKIAQAINKLTPAQIEVSNSLYAGID